MRRLRSCSSLHLSDPNKGVLVDHGLALDLFCYGQPADRLAHVNPDFASCGMPGNRLVVAPGIGEVSDAELGDILLVLLIG